MTSQERTPQWVTIWTLIDLLTRVGACRDAATLYGAAAISQQRRAALRRRRRPPAPIATRLQDHLTATQFRTRMEEGERLDSHRVIGLALDAIARAPAKA